ncbi:hypothetical protein ACFQT0_26090 [Hymenobacter humi]|uniref:Uncharacterized protein n=1 Tax=Hymenobacter humi TaxID=1411620 RepID=A0ABW2UCC9_9BACT
MAVLLVGALAAWQARAEQARRISPPPTDKSVLTRENFERSAQWLDSLGVPVPLPCWYSTPTLTTCPCCWPNGAAGRC